MHACVGVHVHCMPLCTICIYVHMHMCAYLHRSCVHIYTHECLTMWECVCVFAYSAVLSFGLEQWEAPRLEILLAGLCLSLFRLLGYAHRIGVFQK